MALIKAFSFDGLPDGQDGYTELFGGTNNGNRLIDADGGRRGGGALDYYSVAIAQQNIALGSSLATLIFGFAFKAGGSYLGGSSNTIGFDTLDLDTSNPEVWLQIQPTSGTILIKNKISGTGYTNRITGGINICDGTWHWIEVKITLANSGYIELRVDGTVEGTYTGDTLYDAVTPGCGNIYLYCSRPGGNDHMLFDDMVIMDATGDVANDFQGDCRVDYLPCNAAGSNTEFTPLSGANYENIDDAVCDLTNYNSSPTLNAKDTFGVVNLPVETTGTIVGVQGRIISDKSDPTVRRTTGVIRSGGTDYDNSEDQLETDTRQAKLFPWTLNPNGNTAWDETAVNAIEFGYKIAL